MITQAQITEITGALRKRYPKVDVDEAMANALVAYVEQGCDSTGALYNLGVYACREEAKRAYRQVATVNRIADTLDRNDHGTFITEMRLQPREGHAAYVRLKSQGQPIPDYVRDAHRKWDRDRKRKAYHAA